jgi:uncharacterized protein involved in response to NO
MTRLDLIRTGPFRILFPLGILCGILGVGHWILWSVGWVAESQSYFHSSIQVQGFLTCFVVGFWMTAIPRFLGSRPASLLEVTFAVAAVFCFLLFTFTHAWMAAQTAFLALVATVIVFGARRFRARSKRPPASFLLAAFGLLHAVTGSVLMIASGFGSQSVALMETGRNMTHIGFLLCLVLGIAGYLAPFLTGYAGDPSCDPNVIPLRGYGWAGWLLHGGTGAAIFASFWVAPHPGEGLRAAAALLHQILFARLYRFPRKRSGYAVFFWVAFWMVSTGLWATYLWPDYRLAGLHLLFINGFSLMIFSFAMMVILSHGAEAFLLNKRLIPLNLVCYSVFAAGLLRALADLDAWNYQRWIHAASGTWVLAAALWLIYVFPKLWRFPAPED